MATFYDIDPMTCTKEELEEAIKTCKNKEDYYNGLQLSTKKAINSIYGVFGTEYYSLCNTDIAESITLQGQDLIKFSVKAINKYFNDIWHTAATKHQQLYDYLKEKYPDMPLDNFMERCKQQLQFGETLQVYGDTDSAYITLQPLIDSLQIPLEYHMQFIMALNECVITEYFDIMFKKYADFYNCEKNLEKFELEKVARSVIMLVKKKYIMNLGWKEPNIFVEPLHAIIYKGIEAIQGAIPTFCRNEMKDFIKYILSEIDKGNVPSSSAIVKKINEIKARFSIQSPNEISKMFKIANYENFLTNDKVEPPILNDKCPIHVRAAATYNSMLYGSAKKYKSKYQFIHTGDKIKFYYIDKEKVFGFLPDLFPAEFAPKMDIDYQFEKMLLEPLNRIVVAIGLPPVSPTLTYSAELW